MDDIDVELFNHLGQKQRAKQNRSDGQKVRRQQEFRRAKELHEANIPALPRPKNMRDARAQAGRTLKIEKEATVEAEKRTPGLYVSKATQEKRAKRRAARLARGSNW